MKDYKEKILQKLVDSYRKSKKDAGTNIINKRTIIKPKSLYRNYYSNDGSSAEINGIDKAVDELSKKGFVFYKTETFGSAILEIWLNDSRINDIESYLMKNYGFVSKDNNLKKLNDIICRYRDKNTICQSECSKLKFLYDERRVPANIDSLDNIFKAIDFIENNKTDLFIREFSCQVFGDSKYFVDEHIIEPVCNILCNYNDMEEEYIGEVLERYHIHKEFQILSFKGNAVLIIKGKEMDISGLRNGIEMSAADLGDINEIRIRASRVMTIENRTSYLRYYEPDTFIFYLGGYTNRFQKEFLSILYRDNPELSYHHFGDIDAGGFYIHNNLKEVTGIPFKLFCMSENILSDTDYKKCLHGLTDNDICRLQELEKNPEYERVVHYMLDHNVKLEQEMVSLNLMKEHF